MRLWNRQVDCFSSKYRVIALDTRGHGKSTIPPGDIDPELLWQDVTAIMDHLDIKKAVLCGLSMGGHIALRVAISAQERVAGLILVGAVCTSKMNLLERVCLPFGNLFMGFMPTSWIAKSLCIMAGRHSQEAKAYIWDAVNNCDHSVIIRSFHALFRMDSRANLSKLTCPTLILFGEGDIITRHQQKYMHQHIAGSHLVSIKNAHHATNLDNPQQVEDEIETFLARIL
jgi:pimeloyl-ACP methyl ester carboxylesterase